MFFGAEVPCNIPRLFKRGRKAIPQNEFFSRSRNILVLGDPGVGKTVMAKEFVYDIARGEGKLWGIPETEEILNAIYIPGNAIREPISSSQELVKLCASLAFYSSVPSTYFEKIISEGKSIFVLDGIDEISNANVRRKTIRFMNKLARQQTQLRFVFTSRPAGYPGGLSRNSVSKINLIGFDLNARETLLSFIKDWLLEGTLLYYRDIICPESRKRHKEEYIPNRNSFKRHFGSFEYALDEAPHLRNLLRTPVGLGFSLLSSFWYTDRFFPFNYSLYTLTNHGFECMIHDWRNAHDIDRYPLFHNPNYLTGKAELFPEDQFWQEKCLRVFAETVPFFLEELAFKMHELGVREIEEKAVQSLFHQTLEENCEILEVPDDNRYYREEYFKKTVWDLEKKSILIRVGKGNLAFPHLTFQELLTARHLLGYQIYLTKIDSLQSGNLSCVEPSPFAGKAIEKGIDYLFRHRQESWWRNSILFFVGLLVHKTYSTGPFSLPGKITQKTIFRLFGKPGSEEFNRWAKEFLSNLSPDEVKWFSKNAEWIRLGTEWFRRQF